MTTFAKIDQKARKEIVPNVAYAIQEAINNSDTEQVGVSNDGIGMIWFDSLTEMLHETGITHVVTFDTWDEFEEIRFA